MILRAPRVAAAALEAAALAPSPVPAASAPEAERVAAAERLARAAERSPASIERLGGEPQETAALHAGRRCEDGREQYDRGEWVDAAVLLADAVDASPAPTAGAAAPKLEAMP